MTKKKTPLAKMDQLYKEELCKEGTVVYYCDRCYGTKDSGHQEACPVKPVRNFVQEEMDQLIKDIREKPLSGVKYDQDKQRWDLLPRSIDEVILVYTEGAKKYTDRNWEKGLSWSRIYGAMLRHTFAWWFGGTRHERGMHHLGSVAWCALALMEYERTHPELDDRPKDEVPE